MCPPNPTRLRNAKELIDTSQMNYTYLRPDNKKTFCRFDNEPNEKVMVVKNHYLELLNVNNEVKNLRSLIELLEKQLRKGGDDYWKLTRKVIWKEEDEALEEKMKRNKKWGLRRQLQWKCVMACVKERIYDIDYKSDIEGIENLPQHIQNEIEEEFEYLKSFIITDFSVQDTRSLISNYSI